MIGAARDRLFAERVLEFFRSSLPWARSLWTPGLALSLHEILEACEAQQAGILSEATLKRMCSEAVYCVANEAGISNGERKVLIDALNGNRAPGGTDLETIRHFAVDLTASYLARVASALRQNPNLNSEKIARAIAAHLLDHDFSNPFLHRWCKYQILHGASNMADLADAGAALVAKGKHSYKVHAAFDGVPENADGYPENYVPATEFSEWLAVHSPESAGVRQNGALLLSVLARDHVAAAIAGSEIVRLLEFRCALGANKSLKPMGKLWIERQGDIRAIPLVQVRRSVEVHALFRESKLYVMDPAARLDSVLELMGTLKSGAPGPAASSGWAAVEALVSGAGDQDSIAAERLASIVACSYPRAELTDLAYKVLAAGGPLATTISGLGSNRDKSCFVAQEMLGGKALPITEPADLAALDRVRALLDDPQRELARLQRHFASALHRLYRHRNLVLHGGRTGAIGLRASLRAVAPIVGAGVDRIAHAWLVQKMSGLELAARANIGLATSGERPAHLIVSLLE